MYFRVFIKLLRIASFAKKHIETGREFKDKLPKYSNIGLLLSVESYNWLLELEKYNFNVFESNLQKLSTYNLPKKMLNEGKNGSY